MHSKSYVVKLISLIICMGHKEMEKYPQKPQSQRTCLDGSEHFTILSPIVVDDRYFEDSPIGPLQTNLIEPLYKLKEDNKRKRSPEGTPEGNQFSESFEIINKQTRENKILQQIFHPERHKELNQIPIKKKFVDEEKTKEAYHELDRARLFNKDNDGDTMLHLTIVHNDENKTKLLVAQMSGNTLDIFNKLRQTPLHLSILTCQPTIIRYLVRHGANVNVRDRNGQTPLHLACKNADIDSVNAIKEGLVLRGKYSGHDEMSCNLKNFQGQTALHLAVLSGSCEITKKLLDMNATIDAQDGTSGRTPLHHAIEAHNINMVEFLLQNHANVNASTFSGNTPLHTAMGRHMDQIAQILIRFGANINLKNVEGDTPLDVKISRRLSNMRHVRRTRKLTMK